MSVQSELENQCDPTRANSWTSSRYAHIANGPFRIMLVPFGERPYGRQRPSLWKIVDCDGEFIARGPEHSIRKSFAALELSYAHYLMTKPDSPTYDPLEETQEGDA